VHKLLDEFGEKNISVEQVMSFVKDVTDNFSHKDANVRDTAKELTTLIYQIIGEDVFLFLDSLPARQLREYKASFANSRINLSGSRSTDLSTRSPLNSLPQVIDDNTSFNGLRELVDKPQQSRGRGRGRGKVLPVVQRESPGYNRGERSRDSGSERTDSTYSRHRDID